MKGELLCANNNGGDTRFGFWKRLCHRPKLDSRSTLGWDNPDLEKLEGGCGGRGDASLGEDEENEEGEDRVGNKRSHELESHDGKSTRVAINT